MPSDSSDLCIKFDLFAERYRQHYHTEAVHEEGHLDWVKPCVKCLRMLIDAGFNDSEIQHILDVPAPMREEIRKAMSRAVRQVLPMRFRWRATDEEEESAKIEHDWISFTEPIEEIIVTFLIPKSRSREPVTA